MHLSLFFYTLKSSFLPKKIPYYLPENLFVFHFRLERLWNYVDDEKYAAMGVRVALNTDMTYFFYDHMSHALYNKFIGEVKKSETPFGYIATVNMDSVIRQIYDDFCKESVE